MELSSRYKELQVKDLPDFHNNELLKACLHNEQLLSELLYANKEFALSIIQSYVGRLDDLKDKFNVEEEDLLQLAFLGITQALRTFDFDRNIKFTTYCYRPILWEIKPYIYKDAWTVPLSRGAVKLLGQMMNVSDSLGYIPPAETLAEMLEVSVERIHEVYMFGGGVVSLDSPAIEESLDTILEDPDQFELGLVDSVYIKQLVAACEFDETEKKVVKLMLKDYSNSRIAEELGVYPMTINRIQERMRSKVSRDFFDKRSTKYTDEVDIISEDMIERNEKMSIDDISELLEVCGYDLEDYSSRVLYYIRQRALLKVEEQGVILDD